MSTPGNSGFRIQAHIKVQDCGCISLPDDLALALGIGPGSVLELTSDPSSRSLTLRNLASADSIPDARQACPLPPSRT